MYGRIVVGVAKTDSAKRAVDVAVDLAQRYEAELHLVMAFDRSGTALDSVPRKQAEAFLASLESVSPVPVQVHAIPGDPADTVLMVANEVGADLVVVGNRGMRGAARRVLGSVPNTIAHGAPCSVLIADTTS
jgi:nucleotide-binding universal stress UspA family protein